MTNEILNANYWENFKFYEEIVRIYGAKHEKSIKLAEEVNKIREKLK